MTINNVTFTNILDEKPWYKTLYLDACLVSYLYPDDMVAPTAAAPCFKPPEALAAVATIEKAAIPPNSRALKATISFTLISYVA